LKGVDVKGVAVLILGSPASGELSEIVYEMGFLPLMREDLHGALVALRHEQLGAVIIDAARARVDILEFILNVRDFDEEVPIIIADGSQLNGKHRGVLELQKVPMVALGQDRTIFMRELEAVINEDIY
jgi:hypothetical protein